MSEKSREQRAFAAANQRRTRSKEADEKLDAALKDLTDWRAYCSSCNRNIVGSMASISSHALSCSQRN